MATNHIYWRSCGTILRSAFFAFSLLAAGPSLAQIASISCTQDIYGSTGLSNVQVVTQSDKGYSVVNTSATGDCSGSGSSATAGFDNLGHTASAASNASGFMSWNIGNGSFIFNANNSYSLFATASTGLAAAGGSVSDELTLSFLAGATFNWSFTCSATAGETCWFNGYPTGPITWTGIQTRSGTSANFLSGFLQVNIYGSDGVSAAPNISIGVPSQTSTIMTQANYVLTITPTAAIPEPSAYALTLVGGLLIVVGRKRRSVQRTTQRITT
jgi:hypothetical protein